jgi:6-phosphogluconolactonase
MATAAHYKPNVEIVSDAEHLAFRSVELFVADAEKAIRAKDVFYTAISGGNTPRRFFELLGEMPSAKALAWDKVQLFWVDERLVEPDSPRSNYRLAAETFLPKVGIPQGSAMTLKVPPDDMRKPFGRFLVCQKTKFRNLI